MKLMNSKKLTRSDKQDFRVSFGRSFSVPVNLLFFTLPMSSTDDEMK